MERAKATAEEIAERLRQTGESPGTRAWSRLIPAVLLLASGLGTIYGASVSDSAIGYQIGTVLLALAAICGVLALWSLRTPTLALTREGLHTSSYGFIPWQSIDGLRLRAIRGVYALDLSTPGLPGLTSQMRPLARILFRMRFGPHRLQLRFRLSPWFDRACLLSRVAELLWESRTERRNNWFPDDPAFTSRLRRLEGDQRQRPRDGGDGTAELEQLHRRFAQHDDLVALLSARKDLERRRARRVAAFLAIAFLALVAYLAVRVTSQG